MTVIVVFVLIIVVVGGFAVYLAQQAASRRAMAELRGEFERRLQLLQAKLDEVGHKPAAPVSAPPVAALVAAPVAAPPPPVVEPPVRKPITPEIIALIAAAVTAALGKKVRIRSAKLLQQQPDFVTSPWAQQGRVFVQASHNLHLRGR